MKIFADCEEWKDITSYEGLYKISNLGNVKSLKRNIILKPSKDKKGYLRVNLYNDGNTKTFLVHQLVAIEFIPNPNNLIMIDHKNTIPYDNNVENLQWTTYSENNNNEITRRKNSMAKTGENHPLYGRSHREETIIKMINSNNNKKVIQQFSMSGEFIKEWESGKSIERELGYISNNIYKCCNGERKTANGYVWRYL